MTSINQQRVIKFVQELLLDESPDTVTASLISEKMDMVTAMNPKWGESLDRQAVTDELIRRFSLWIGQDATLKDNVGHTDWLGSGRKKDWRYWQRYREWQEGKLSTKVVDKLDESTDAVLGLLEDPTRDGPWDRRGLVVGHVQSGKTGHYTGLICKAADAGYKIIIVLAGMHNNLRSQTQMRLDEGFLGYETSPVPDELKTIGVGNIDGDPFIRPNYATNRSDKGDFNTAVARHLGIKPEQRPWLFVIKKNKTVLERLLRWIEDHVANTHDTETGRKLVTNLPLLVIDDESDHASVDTGEQVVNEDGTPDEEHEPKTINRLIRRILFCFTRSAYVGYTATPFANIFIHERGKTREEGPDLFPSAFIVNLAAPSNYVGPSRIFGLEAESERHNALPLVRTVEDHWTDEGRSGWMPQSHKNGHVPLIEGESALPASLEEAICSYILACAVRYVRGQRSEHSSMLVHVTRFNSVQNHVFTQVGEYLRHIKQRVTRKIDHQEIERRLQQLWENDFVKTTEAIQKIDPELASAENIKWSDIYAMLPDVVSDIQVKTINGTAKDALDYAEHQDTGLKVIAVGGDKLARGLTLEGLVTSYFLRASRMYDTLMQMGRWFGYRPGYLDVCRLYTTPELAEWFGHIADASEELREEFDLMAASGATPREYGLKVASHPVLMVTSRLKMRAARNLMLSFSGQLLETIALYRDKSTLDRNLNALKSLVEGLGKPQVNPERARDGVTQKWTGFLWDDVPADHVVKFLGAYKTHPEAHKVNSLMLAEFIQTMVASRELTSWTVALIGGGEGASLSVAPGIAVDMLQRSQRGKHEDRYSIGRLMSSRDEAIDLDAPGWAAALALTRSAWHADPGRAEGGKTEPDVPNGPATRKIRGFGAEGVTAHPERGVLFLYALDPAKADAGFSESTSPVIAFGISFPGSRSGIKVEYKVNNVLWEQEYGSGE